MAFPSVARRAGGDPRAVFAGPEGCGGFGAGVDRCGDRAERRGDRVVGVVCWGLRGPLDGVGGVWARDQGRFVAVGW